MTQHGCGLGQVGHTWHQVGTKNDFSCTIVWMQLS